MKHRADERDADGGGERERPARGARLPVPVLRIGVDDTRDEYLARVGGEADNRGQIAWFIPQRMPRRYDGNVQKVVGRRRRWNDPLEPGGRPRVVVGARAAAQAREYVDEKHDDARDDRYRAKRRHQIERPPTRLR